MKYTLLLLLINCSFLAAQSGQLDFSAQEEGIIELTPYIHVLRDTTVNLSWQETKEKQVNGAFSPFQNFKYRSRLERGKYAYWFYLAINYQETVEHKMIFRCSGMDTVELFQVVDGLLIDHKKGGNLVVTNYDKNTNYTYFKYDLPFFLAPNAKNEILVRLRSLPSIEPQLSNPVLFKEVYSTLKSEKYYFVYYLIFGSFLGILSFVIIFTLVQYFQNKDISFLYYTIYVATLFLFFLRKFYLSNPIFSFEPTWLIHTQYYTYYSLLNYIFYLLFLRSFLDTKANFPLFNRFIRYALWYIAIYFVLERIMMHFDLNLAYRFEKISRPIFMIIGLAALVFLAKSKNKLAFYASFGTFSLLFFTLLELALSFMDTPNWKLWQATYIFSVMGILTELLFFSTGLGYKMKMVIEEKHTVQSGLIAQLKENQQLKEKLTRNLQTKLSLLKNQLKPHFIFNCLTSIKNLIVKDEKEAAETYLIRFAELMRETLIFSDKEQVTLAEELHFAENYLELEKMRFRDQFEYTICTGDIETQFILLPPMLFQPFIENAIKHGLLPKDGKRKLSISITENKQHLRCIIQDNGIGRVAAAQIAKKSIAHQKRKSRGIAISDEQLTFYNEYFKTNIRFEIIDLVGENEMAKGTQVEVFIPI